MCVPCQAFVEAGHADHYDATFTGKYEGIPIIECAGMDR